MTHNNEQEWWIEGFDKEFLQRPFEEGIIYASGDEVKSFIRDLLAAERQKWEEELQNAVKAAKDYYYDDVEMIGIDTALDELLDKILSPNHNQPS